MRWGLFCIALFITTTTQLLVYSKKTTRLLQTMRILFPSYKELKGSEIISLVLILNK